MRFPTDVQLLGPTCWSPALSFKGASAAGLGLSLWKSALSPAANGPYLLLCLVSYLVPVPPVLVSSYPVFIVFIPRGAIRGELCPSISKSARFTRQRLGSLDWAF